MDSVVKIDLKEQLKSLFDMDISLSISQIAAIQWAIDQMDISKTETTSARALSCWYCTEIEKHGVAAIKTVLDKAGRELDAYETPYHFCPNCGKRLEAQHD